MAERRVLILGGGVIGTTSAYFLARRGWQVTVVERQSGVGRETSFANGSLVTPSMSDPWAAPDLPWKLLKWMGREDSPFLVRPGAIPGMLSWGLQFLRNCNPGRWQRNTEIIFRMARYSQEVLRDVTAETGVAYDRASLGTLRLFRDEAALAAAKRSAADVGKVGISYRLLDADQCVLLEPALASARKKIAGGIHFPDDESGDAFKFTSALAEICRDAGVDFRFGVRIEAIDTAGDVVSGIMTDAGRLEAEHYLVALGSESAALLRPLGIKVPIYPVKGYSVTVPLDGWNAAPTVPLADDGRKMGIVRLGDRLRLAGTAEFTGFDTSLNPARGANLIAVLQDLFPDCPTTDQGQHWTGLRPMTPDGIPILGASSYRNLYLNLGHGHLGWTMACGSAKVLADLMAGAVPDIDLSGMTVGRG
jgi:D-amino-acid dehydrogenase